MKNTAIILSSMAILFSCSDNSTNTHENSAEGKDSILNIESSMSNDELNNIIHSIPPPLEFSLLIENTGAKYNESFLNKSSNVSNYNSQFSKSINLGIYGADLGYINIYQKTFSAIEYLNTVHSLATDLNIGEYFDFETLKRLAVNNKNLDSIVYITTKSFEKMQRQLEIDHKSDISISMVIGGWIEGLYLTSNIIESSPKSDKLNDLMLTVYDENIVLDDIIKLSSSLNSNPNYQSLTKDLEALKASFDLLKVDADKGRLTEEQFNSLTKEIYSLRNKLIK